MHMQEIVNISPTTLPNYEAKIKSFYEEHIHADDEIRYILDGQGAAGGVGRVGPNAGSVQALRSAGHACMHGRALEGKAA